MKDFPFTNAATLLGVAYQDINILQLTYRFKSSIKIVLSNIYFSPITIKKSKTELFSAKFSFFLVTNLVQFTGTTMSRRTTSEANFGPRVDSKKLNTLSEVEAEKALDLKELLADQRVALAAMSTDQRIAPAAMFAGLVVTTGRSPRLAVVSKAETKGRVSKAEQKQSCRLSRQQSSPRF